MKEQRPIKKEKQDKQASIAKSQFLSAINHEILTPMNAVIGLTELLILTGPTQQQLEYILALKSSSYSLLKHLNDILDFRMMEKDGIANKTVEFSIGKLLDDIRSAFLESANEKGLQLELEIDRDLSGMMTNGDPITLKQILSNLINNAIKFTFHGKIKITAVRLYHNKKNTAIDFEVSDSGIGIAGDKIDYIFESFTQGHAGTTREIGGMGLGLSMTKRLIEMQGGQISVKSQLGSGSAFKFGLVFENNTSQLDEGKKNNPDTVKNSLKGTKILVAEDNEVNIMVVKHVMKLWDVECDFARNGMLALERVKITDYDMVLMDLQMPVMDGYEAAFAIRQLPYRDTKSLPIIAFTTCSENEIGDNIIAAGMNDFIGKPFDPNELYSKIEKYKKIN